MTLADTLTAAGMTPPAQIVPGRWMRFPGFGKGRSNRAGWCRLITPTLAIYGDWSTGITELWKDDTHRDDANSVRLLQEARERERRFAAAQRERQRQAADDAQELIQGAMLAVHPYLARKGFPTLQGLVVRGKLLVPVRDCRDYGRVISVQEIDESGEKRFLTGGRTRGGIYRIGAPLDRAKRIVLCEGYATGLSVNAGLKRVTASHATVVCFSARNLEVVAESLPNAAVCADNDESKTGEQAALRTGLRWAMPPEVGDFNDMHQQHGLLAVTEVLRTLF
jgi:putative DNA primase/helicase